MLINEICDLLKKELLNNGYQYGFFWNGKIYKPDDKNFFDLLSTVYRIQNPNDTIKEKIGTCNDIALLMKSMLDEYDIPNKMWALHDLPKNKYHTVLTFSAENKIVYLELTPQSSKSWYGKEIIYDNEQSFLDEYRKQYEVFDVTDIITAGKTLESLLSELPRQIV